MLVRGCRLWLTSQQKCHFVLSSLTLYTCADEILKFQNSVYMKSKKSFCSLFSYNLHMRRWNPEISEFCVYEIKNVILFSLLLQSTHAQMKSWISDPEHRQPSPYASINSNVLIKQKNKKKTCIWLLLCGQRTERTWRSIPTKKNLFVCVMLTNNVNFTLLLICSF